VVAQVAARSIEFLIAEQRAKMADDAVTNDDDGEK